MLIAPGWPGMWILAQPGARVGRFCSGPVDAAEAELTDGLASTRSRLPKPNDEQIIDQKEAGRVMRKALMASSDDSFRLAQGRIAGGEEKVLIDDGLEVDPRRHEREESDGKRQHPPVHARRTRACALSPYEDESQYGSNARVLDWSCARTPKH